MKKLSTLFKKDPNDLGRVINKVNPENQWVIDGKGMPTRKWDGTACAIIDGSLYKRYDAKRNKKTGMFKEVPKGSIECQEADNITGHHPHWIPCIREDKSNKYHFQAFDKLEIKDNGTYELCGEKVQGNPENISGHELIPHLYYEFPHDVPRTFEGLKDFLTHMNVEGIVFHHLGDGRMCKIRKSDFGIKR